ncbi:MAG: hypothetical protein ACAH59_05525 [Pseudobdellovibrionaceae bacterium]
MLHNRFVFAVLALFFLVEFQASAQNRNHRVKKVSCVALRDEPGAPTYSFELVRQSDRSYSARYLHLPGDPEAPPKVEAEIPDLKCRFYSNRWFYFQCEKRGASVESVEITERTLNLVSDKVRSQIFKEFRSTGTEVPGSFLVYRFASGDICRVVSGS